MSSYDDKPDTPSGDPDFSQDESIPLRIGDYVMLKSTKSSQGLLSANGVLDDQLRYNLQPLMYDTGVFQICYQNQYSAARELQEFLEEQEALVSWTRR